MGRNQTKRIGRQPLQKRSHSGQHRHGPPDPPRQGQLHDPPRINGSGAPLGIAQQRGANRTGAATGPLAGIHFQCGAETFPQRQFLFGRARQRRGIRRDDESHHDRNGQRQAERDGGERQGGPQRQGRDAGETGWRPYCAGDDCQRFETTQHRKRRRDTPGHTDQHGTPAPAPPQAAERCTQRRERGARRRQDIRGRTIADHAQATPPRTHAARRRGNARPLSPRRSSRRGERVRVRGRDTRRALEHHRIRRRVSGDRSSRPCVLLPLTPSLSPGRKNGWGEREGRPYRRRGDARPLSPRRSSRRGERV